MAAADADAIQPEGGASLAGDEASSEIATDLGPVEYLVVGHVTVDLFEKRFILGGSATYSALTAHRLGMSVGVLTSADFEPLLMDTLVGRDNFLQPESPIRVLRLPTQTTTCYVNEYDEHGRRQLLLG